MYHLSFSRACTLSGTTFFKRDVKELIFVPRYHMRCVTSTKKKKYHWLETELVRTASLPPSIEKNKHMLCLCSVLHMRSDNFVSGDFDAFLLCLHAESCIKSSKTVVLGCEEKEATFSTKWVSTPLRHPLKD